MSKAKILVVDDEAGVRDLLSDALRISGYDVATEADGLAALNTLARERFDLVISDINMPKLDGFELLERLRGRADETPVLLLTARDERGDVAEGFRKGADDYLTKPFGLEELVLRTAAILRRTQGAATTQAALSVGLFTMNDDLHEARYDAQLLELSPTEYRLLQQLLLNADRVVTKTTLLSTVWGMDFTTNTGVVDTYVSYLRKKLSAAGYEGLATVRGVGIRLAVSG